MACTHKLQGLGYVHSKILMTLHVSITFVYTGTHNVCQCLICAGSNGQLNEGSRGLVLLQLMPPERLLLCGGRPLNTAPEAGALEITVLRVSEIAPAILIMSPALIPYVHWLQAQRERERERERGEACPVHCSHLPISRPHSLLLVTLNSTSIANRLICFMSLCLPLSQRCVEYCPISLSDTFSTQVII